MSIDIEQPIKFIREAAVLIAVAQICGIDHVLLTKRAAHLNSHSGEVAFPGGMWEPGDESLLDTALRESFEEVNLQPQRVTIVDELNPCYTRQGVRVTPFAGVVDSPEGLVPSEDELEALFWVPLDFFMQDSRVRTDIFNIKGKMYWSPVYQFETYEIWGFTARLLVDFLNTLHGQSIGRVNTAPEKLFSPVR